MRRTTTKKAERPDHLWPLVTTCAVPTLSSTKVIRLASCGPVPWIELGTGRAGQSLLRSPRHLELPKFRKDDRSDTGYQVRECAEVHWLMLLGYQSRLSSINDPAL